MYESFKDNCQPDMENSHIFVKYRSLKFVAVEKNGFAVYVQTVEFQWLEHFWNHENMFETGVV